MDTNNIVQEFRASGKTQHDFCNENGISIEKLRYYLPRLRKLIFLSDIAVNTCFQDECPI